MYSQQMTHSWYSAASSKLLVQLVTKAVQQHDIFVKVWWQRCRSYTKHVLAQTLGFRQPIRGQFTKHNANTVQKRIGFSNYMPA